MSFVLFVLGLIAVAAGVATIGFGIPINEFSLGNTLILAGTAGLASGLVVIALAITNRQLKRIADLLVTRPAGSSGRSSDVLESAAGVRLSTQRPPLPVSADIPPPRPSYSERPLRSAPAEFADEDDFDVPPAPEPHSRLGGAPRNVAPSPAFDPIEDVPVSPRTQPRIPGIGTPPPAAAEPKPAWRPPGARPVPPIDPAARQDLSRQDPSRQDSARHEPSIGSPERPQRPAPDVEFNSIWPADRRPERNEPQADLGPEVPAPRPNGNATQREPAAPREQPARPAGAPTPVSILKSGVVDGMAYTLYTDGSIEAELAQGVVRFGSIEELRNHLEKGA
jgi:hypothetical protein